MSNAATSNAALERWLHYRVQFLGPEYVAALGRMKFWKRDSRTVEAAKKRVTRYLDEKIVYYEVTFCCINGGRKFKFSGEGIRSSL